MIENTKEMQEKILRALVPENIHYEVGVYHVSELVKCIKKIILKRVIPRPATRDSLALLNGITLHKALPNIFKDIFISAEYNVACEHVVSDECKIVGEVDMLWGDTVYEFKLTSTPSYASCMQANAYAVMLKKSDYVVINIVKHSSKFKIEVVKGMADLNKFQLLVDVANVADKAVRTLTPSKAIEIRPLSLEYWECAVCEYKDICKKKKM